MGDPFSNNNNDYFKENIDTTNDEDFIAPENNKFKKSNKIFLRNLAKECDHWGVSNRAGAAIANAALIDAGSSLQMIKPM